MTDELDALKAALRAAPRPEGEARARAIALALRNHEDFHARGATERPADASPGLLQRVSGFWSRPALAVSGLAVSAVVGAVVILPLAHPVAPVAVVPSPVPAPAPADAVAPMAEAPLAADAPVVAMAAPEPDPSYMAGSAARARVAPPQPVEAGDEVSGLAQELAAGDALAPGAFRLADLVAPFVTDFPVADPAGGARLVVTANPLARGEVLVIVAADPSADWRVEWESAAVERAKRLDAGEDPSPVAVFAVVPRFGVAGPLGQVVLAEGALGIPNTPSESDAARFVAALVGFDQVLTTAPIDGAKLDQAIDLAKENIGNDPYGARAAAVGAMTRARALAAP